MQICVGLACVYQLLHNYNPVLLSAASMSTAASQIILHPTVSQSLKVLSTTVGRDKVSTPNIFTTCINIFSRSTEQSRTLLDSMLGFCSVGALLLML